MTNKEQVSITLARAEGLLQGAIGAFEHVLYYHKIPEQDRLTSMDRIRQTEDEILSLLKLANELCKKE